MKRSFLPWLLALVVFATTPARALEVPLSRASFENALKEGHDCERGDERDSYVVVKKGHDPILASLLVNTLNAAVQQDTSDIFLTVRLSTPYTRVRGAACRQAKLGETLDVEALWSSVRDTTTVRLWVEPETVTTTYRTDASQDDPDYGEKPATRNEAGPNIQSLTLRQGEGRDAKIVQPVSSGGGTEFEFPASALQGKGPFYVVVDTEDPGTRMALKLKASVLRQP